jgi:hypothetical protein
VWRRARRDSSDPVETDVSDYYRSTRPQPEVMSMECPITMAFQRRRDCRCLASRRDCKTWILFAQCSTNPALKTRCPRRSSLRHPKPPDSRDASPQVSAQVLAWQDGLEWNGAYELTRRLRLDSGHSPNVPSRPTRTAHHRPGPSDATVPVAKPRSISYPSQGRSGSFVQNRWILCAYVRLTASTLYPREFVWPNERQ